MGGKKVYNDYINFDTEQEENTKLTEKIVYRIGKKYKLA